MADYKSSKRHSSDEVEGKRKKVKTDGLKKEEDDEDKKNPYLAHMYENNANGFSSDDPFAHFKVRETTAKQVEAVENLDHNAFTGKAHTQKYFDILRVRRDLPVHKQRYAPSISVYPHAR